MGIERVYDTATHPGLSIKVPMSETGQNRDSQGREYNHWFVRNRFGHFPEFYDRKSVQLVFDLQFWTVRERYYILFHFQTKLRELFI